MSTPSQNDRDLFKEYLGGVSIDDLGLLLGDINRDRIPKQSQAQYLLHIYKEGLIYLYETGHFKRTPESE